MSLTLLRHTTQKPPLGPLKLDGGNPLAQNLLFFAGPGPSQHEWLSGHAGALNGSATWQGSNAAGPALNLPDTTASAASWNMGAAWQSQFTGDFTVAVQANIIAWSTADQSYLIAVPASFADAVIGIEKNNSNAWLSCSYSTGQFASNVADFTTVTAPTGLHTIVVTRTGASFTCYVDGLAKQTVTGSAGFNTASPPGWVDLGFPVHGAHAGAQSTINYGALWKRALSAAEVSAFTAEPYAMFQTRPMQRWLTVPSGAAFDPSTMPWRVEMSDAPALALVGF